MLNTNKRPLYITILACIQIIGIALFCKGFFPYKIYLPGYATKDDIPSSLKDLHNEPEFDRLVFIVIDALRNDFVLGQDSGFDFINSQIQKGSAFPFTAKATAPTVTMPRIKAMTTGTVPSFLDAILNIAESDTSSSLDFHDNWVYQLKNNGNKTIHFFGDDTWIRLFPNLFEKTDGTTSFFVSDTVQVDLNVTRHIETDLVQSDWDAVIFHYLGLDHIGHLGGPNSPLMKPKQKEMDQAVESIYDIVSKQDAVRMRDDSNARGTLIVVCGDHGMNEKGNHGGSSVGETSAALVFLSPRFESRPSIKRHVSASQNSILGHPVIDQIDIVPTLATLFGFPIPKNNLGKVIDSLYNTENAASVINGLALNAHQLVQLLSKLFPELSRFIKGQNDYDQNSPSKYYAEAIDLHETYKIEKTEQIAQDTIKAYYKSLTLPTQTIREKWYPIALGMGQLILVRVTMSWTNTMTLILSDSELKWHLMFLALLCTFLFSVRSMYNLDQKHAIDVNQTVKIVQTVIKVVLGSIIALNSILVLVYKMRAQNTDLPNLYQSLLNWELVLPLNQVQLGKLIYNYEGAGLFVLGGLFYVIKRATLMTMGESNNIQKNTSLILQLLLHLSTPLLILLSEPQNAFLFVIFNLQFEIILQWRSYLSNKSPIPSWFTSILVCCLSHSAFFLTGHTNSIASVDLSNAYVGVQEYDTILIGILTFCSNWSVSLWWAIAGWTLIADASQLIPNESANDAAQPWISYIIVQSSLFGLVLTLLSIAVTILKEHLFIWTVFSPKYLYQVAWVILFHWIFQTLLGSLFTQILFRSKTTLTISEDDEELEE
ncbi:alkaline-phosphatase-like protein [Helicostylum pulchrum]|nr:alkaline-phosphatase-like protein [Helicostylum pulchrum]